MKKGLFVWYGACVVWSVFTADTHSTWPVGKVLELYKKHGNEQYMIGESVTQESHALQTAHLLLNAYASPNVIAAGFLHDIGQLVNESRIGDTQYLHRHHPDLGADWLKENGFPEIVVDCARYHALAKIHLCKTCPEYQQLLSPASLESLRIQQQQYTEEHYQQFLKLPHLNALLAIRKCDDMAKQPNFKRSIMDVVIYYLNIARNDPEFGANDLSTIISEQSAPQDQWIRTVDEMFAVFVQQHNASTPKL
jgi:putative nucleotidyltransferase with HDIG domain